MWIEEAAKWVSQEQLKYVQCKCGCGNKIIIKLQHYYTKIPDFITGHFSKTEDFKKSASERGKQQIHPPCSDNTRKKLSQKFKGRISGRKGKTAWNKGKKFPEYCGINNPKYSGGKRMSIARSNHKRRLKGFIPLTLNNPYSEEIIYHHINPNLPYVVPCPKRIHEIFREGKENQRHCEYVNLFLGIIKIDF